MEDLRNSRDVFVTEDGRVEDGNENADPRDQDERSRERSSRGTRLKPDVFGREDVIKVSERVFALMHAEARRFEGETGGLVVGPDDTTLTELIPSGDDARRTMASYELDVPHLQPRLEEAEARGLRFLGIWHVHPEGVSTLSGTDRATAKRILADADYRVSRLLLPLSVRNGTGVETTFFLAEGEEPEIRPLRVVVVSDDPSHVEPPTATMAAGARAAAKRHRRLATDQRALTEAGFRVSLRRRAEGSWAMLLRRGERHLVLLLPREYPVSPPDVLERVGTRLVRVPSGSIPETLGWSSQRSVVAVAEQAELVAQGWVDRVGRWVRDSGVLGLDLAAATRGR